MQVNEPVRKLTTILCADAAGFSRMMRSDEEGTFQVLRRCRETIQGLIAKYQGRVFSTAGDSIVAEFASPVEALRCSAAIHRAIEELGDGMKESHRMEFRIGINLGDVLVEGTDLIGDGVNVAARIQQASSPGETRISASVHEVVKNQPDFSYDDLGGLRAKNIAEPIHVYRVRSVGARRHGRPRRGAVLGGVARAAIVAAVIAGTFGTAAYLGYLPLPTMHAKPETRSITHASIAVLPFDNQTGDPEQEYFVAGISDDITLALGRFSDLLVIASEAVQPYKGKTPRLGELKADLGVGYVLSGSVSRSGDHVRVKVELSDTTTGAQLWPGGYDGQIKDVFAFQDRVTEGVVGALAIKISDIERQRSLAKKPENMQAYDYVQRGRELYRQNTRPANREARKMFEQAIAQDPGYAAAYVGRALSRMLNISSGWSEPSNQAFTDADADARTALQLDNASAEAHAALSRIYLLRSDYDPSLVESERAIALNPNDWFSHATRGGALVFSGRPEEAITSFDTAMRLNPSMEVNRLYPASWAHYLVHDYSEAVRLSLSGDSRDYFNSTCLAAADAQLGKLEEAAHAITDAKTIYPLLGTEVFAAQFRRKEDQELVREGLRKAGLK